MIPKIIHYCWFGQQSIPEDQKTLIREWQQILPDYELKLWNESNSPLNNRYCQMALSSKKWANLSNFVRFHALLSEGGIYLDTDIKLLRSFDPLLHYQCFLGFENDKEIVVNNAVIGSIPHHPFISKCLQAFDAFSGDEKAHESAPLLVTNILKGEYHLNSTDTQELGDVALLSKEYFYPIHWNETYKLNSYEKHITENTYCVHLWNQSWFTHEMLHNTINDWQKWANDLSSENKRLQEVNDLLFKHGNDAIQKNINDLREKISASNEAYAKSIELILKRIEYLEEKFTFLEEKLIQERSKLEQIIFDNQVTIKWYQDTYENRSLPGLIRQWFKKKS
jgi:mannosyltransferase OCH1-like enzyme